MVHTAASSGTVLSMHFCMGSFASLKIGFSEKQGCDKCGMDNKGCCHDDIKVIKLNGDPVFNFITSENFPTPGGFIPHFSYFSENPIFKDFSKVYIQYSHNIDKSPPIFLMNCTFLI